MAKWSGVQVIEFGVGWPPRLLGRTWRGTLYSLNIIPVGAFVRMLGEDKDADSPWSFSGKAKRYRALILVAGSAMNIILAPVLFGAAALINDFESMEVTAVAINSPAQHAGLLIGDRVEGVASQKIKVPSDLGKLVQGARGRQITIAINRNGLQQRVSITPRLTHPSGEGPMGISIKPYFAPAPLPRAIFQGFSRTLEAILLLPKFISALTTGSVGFEAISGPVGIVTAVGEATQRGPEVVLMLAGFITVQLGVLNLLPWPGLDGGRLVILGVEGLRKGRRLPPAQEGTINFLGMLVLLLLVVIVTVGDVHRIVAR